jgi:hypothetical protein
MRGRVRPWFLVGQSLNGVHQGVGIGLFGNEDCRAGFTGALAEMMITWENFINLLIILI